MSVSLQQLWAALPTKYCKHGHHTDHVKDFLIALCVDLKICDGYDNFTIDAVVKALNDAATVVVNSTVTQSSTAFIHDNTTINNTDSRIDIYAASSDSAVTLGSLYVSSSYPFEETENNNDYFDIQFTDDISKGVDKRNRGRKEN